MKTVLFLFIISLIFTGCFNDNLKLDINNEFYKSNNFQINLTIKEKKDIEEVISISLEFIYNKIKDPYLESYKYNFLSDIVDGIIISFNSKELSILNNQLKDKKINKHQYIYAINAIKNNLKNNGYVVKIINNKIYIYWNN